MAVDGGVFVAIEPFADDRVPHIVDDRVPHIVDDVQKADDVDDDESLVWSMSMSQSLSRSIPMENSIAGSASSWQLSDGSNSSRRSGPSLLQEAPVAAIVSGSCSEHDLSSEDSDDESKKFQEERE